MLKTHRVRACAFMFIMFDLLVAASYGQSLPNTTAGSNSSETRNSSMRLQIRTGQTKDQVCSQVVKMYRSFYISRQNYLALYYDIVRKLDCPQLKQECALNSYAKFSPYTRLLTQEVCNRTLFIQACKPKVQEVLGTNEGNWTKLTSALMGVKDSGKLGETCVQVALHDHVLQTYGYTYGRFEEAKEVQIPYGGITWCGINKENMNHLSVYFCAPTRTKSAILGVLIYLGLLCALIAFTNLLALLVIISNNDLRNGQGIFRLNLAITDLISGLFILPVSIYLYSHMVKKFTYPPIDPALAAYAQSFFDQPVVDYSQVDLLKILALFKRAPDPTVFGNLINSLGFMMNIVIQQSMYCLACAGLDRLIAISFPFQYDQRKSKIFAFSICMLCWCIAAVYSLVPIFNLGGTFYALTLNMFVFPNGKTDIVTTGICIPFALMWLISILIFLKIRHHNKTLRHKTTSQRQNIARTERRLANTLGIMVGCFSVCLLPNITLLIYLKHIKFINFSDVENASLSDFNRLIDYNATAILIELCNSACNFFIYQNRDQIFKTQVLKLFGKKPDTLRPTNSGMARSTTVTTSM